MEAQSYTDTILLQANRKSSAEYLSGNSESKASWTNDLGSGIKLDIGDTISVHSAYISEIGCEDATIEIKGRNATNNVGERQSYTTKNVTLVKTEGQKNNGSSTYSLQSDEGNYSWEYQENENTHQITDDTIHLTHSYYKCSQGDNYISLPRAWGADDRRAWWDGAHDWSASNSSFTGAVDSPNPYRLGSDYSFIRTFGNASNGYGYEVNETTIGKDRTEIANDGRRYTLFVRKSFKNYTPEGQKTNFVVQGEKDPALMDFIWYRKTVKYEVSKGFNSPQNVATQITNKMNDIDNIEKASIKTSSSKPNIQNLPQLLEIRNTLIADEGFTFLVADFSGQEVLIAADKSKEPVLVDALVQGKDHHSFLSSKIYSIIFGQTIEVSNKKEPLIVVEGLEKTEMYEPKQLRTDSKPGIFGFFYGGGTFRMKNIYIKYLKKHVLRNQRDTISAKISETYKKNLPVLYDWLKGNIGVYEALGYITPSIIGRRIRFKENGYGDILNCPIQGTGADSLKLAIAYIADYIEAEIEKNPEIRDKVYYLFNVHDEIILHIHKDYLYMVDTFIALMKKGLDDLLSDEGKALGLKAEIDYQLTEKYTK